ncbi:restriction endonuclease subunit S [Vibrio splendidus]|uniref:Type I restriction endonuclease subunit S n=1 Tax=Vibrio splendidus 12E03 TaxID=1191305 RepID=A0A1E5FRU6_VIBSP|nr:restriction endonuclease subunit S [Vibrio splendidus]OEF93156.1 type I restriction endonuclease subunit S [Vibrio splendidus 12E03]
MTEQMNVPTLRFGEFDGEWINNIFNDISSITRLAGYEYSTYWEEDPNQEIIALRGYNVGSNKLVLRDLSYISDKLSKQLNRSRLSKGDIVYPCVGTIGNSVVIEEDDKYHIQQNIAKITCDNNTSPYFVSQFLSSFWGMREVYRFNATSSQPNVLVGSLRNFKISLPQLLEQQKIVSFLSKVDEKISLLTEKKDKLIECKKGVMQQLFNGKWEEQDGQLNFIPPTLRFKADEGSDFPDWKKSTLGDIGKVKMCKRIMANQTSENGDIPFFKIGTFGREPDAFISQELYDEYRHKFSFPNVGDILMSASGTLGRTVVYDGSPAYFQDSNIVWIENDGSYTTNEFLFYVYQIVKYQSEGGTIQRLYNNIIMSAVFDNPSLKEQKKIVKFLSAIDQKIDLANLELEKAKEWKKGLLQQMFV